MVSYSTAASALLLLLSTATAARLNASTNSIAIKKNLLSKATSSRSSSSRRQLNGNDDGYDISWMENYSVKFAGCSTIPNFEREEGVRSTLLAKFKLCPSDKCGSCKNGGEYVIEMREFIESYNDLLEEANEAACEAQEESCENSCQVDDNGGYYYENYNGNDDEACQYQCMTDAGMGFCDNDNNNNGEDDYAELAECRPINEDNDDYATDIYYVGAYCTSSGVYLHVFSDSQCQKKASNDIYYKQTGYNLPTSSLVSNDCISCGNDANDDDNGDDAILDSCEEFYEKSAKCERNMKIDNKDTSSCTFIHSTLPSMNRAYTRKVNWSLIFAIVFGLGFILLAGYLCLLKRSGQIEHVDNSKLMEDNTNNGAASHRHTMS